jgi:hypothetical protein
MAGHASDHRLLPELFKHARWLEFLPAGNEWGKLHRTGGAPISTHAANPAVYTYTKAEQFGSCQGSKSGDWALSACTPRVRLPQVRGSRLPVGKMAMIRYAQTKV